MKLLFVASDQMEFRGLVNHCTGISTPAIPVGWARSGHLGAHEVLLTANGARAHRAVAAVDAAVKPFQPDAILSIGFCGALDPALRIAEIVVGSTIFAGERGFAAESPLAAPAHRLGAVCSVDHVAATAVEKAQLHATGAIAVEMEAAGVAVRAQKDNLPFFCIKAVSDMASETMVNDFNSALRADGHFDTIKILASSLRQPWARLPELVRLRARCAQAARSLGDFIADCQF